MRQFPLGTDSLGRCVLSRLLYGARVAMTVAIVASFGAMLIGAVLAHIAGYFGGWVDWLIGRAVDVWMSFPPVILSLDPDVGARHRRAQRDPRDRAGRLDALLPRAARRGAGGGAARLRRGRAPGRLSALAHGDARDPARHHAAADHAAQPRDGHRGDRRGDPVLRRHERRAEPAGLGPDDRRRAADIYNPPGTCLPMLAIFITVLGFNVLGDGLRRTLDVRLPEAREV